jgi:energy-coupling factor transporter ATP-binding protein EcfA2
MNLPKRPYVGLRAFEPDESSIFFGRQRLVNDLVNRLSKNHFLAVTGESGSGKSSLVFTGLIDALYKGYMSKAGSKWTIIKMRPSNAPIENLARAILAYQEIDDENRVKELTKKFRISPKVFIDYLKENGDFFKDKNLLIIVDQFEELFTYNPDINSAKILVNILLYCSMQRELPIFSVITMRSDYLGDCTLFDGLPEAINNSQFLTPRLTRDEMIEAITNPLLFFDMDIEELLVNKLLNDMGTGSDQLPLLQHTLMMLFDISKKMDKKELTLKDYHDIGTLKDALSSHADEIYNSFEKREDRFLIKKIFQSITELNDKGKGVRSPITLEKLAIITGAREDKVLEVIKLFRSEGVNFLVPYERDSITSDTMIDITHESLIKQWKMLKRWIKEEAESQKYYANLKYQALEYYNGHHELLRGLSLTKARRWKSEENPTALWARDSEEEFAKVLKYLQDSNENKTSFKEATHEQKEFKYQAFIAYEKGDIKFAKKLQKDIENYAIPKGLQEKYPNIPKNLKRSVFFDIEESSTSLDVAKNVYNAIKTLEESKTLIVLCSPNSAKSKWVNQEIIEYKKFHGERNIYSVILDGEPYDDTNECFPEALKYEVDSDGNFTDKKVEPLAVDARNIFNRQKVLLQLISSLLGVDFSDLYKREALRKRKRIFLFGIPLVLFFIFIGIYSIKNYGGDIVNRDLESLKSQKTQIEYRIRNEN